MVRNYIIIIYLNIQGCKISKKNCKILIKNVIYYNIMEKLSDINYNLSSFTKTPYRSVMELNIKGNDINYVIINTIRRSILTYIPIYAYDKFIFKTNETVFNNNYIKLHLEHIPVFGIENNLDIYNNKQNEPKLNEQEENELQIDDDIDMEVNKNINMSSLKQLTMYVEYTSNSKVIESVTTDHARFYYEEKNIQSPYKIPLQIVKIHPGQTISFSAITNIGTEQIDAKYSPVTVCYYKEVTANEYTFIIESKGQLTEQRIIEVGLINIINTIENFAKLIPIKTESYGEIIVNGENNTVGNLISFYMQKHKKVKFAGYNIPHLLDDKVVIHYELIDNKTKLKDVIDDVIVYLIELFKKLIKLNSKIIVDENKKEKITKHTNKKKVSKKNEKRSIKKD